MFPEWTELESRDIDAIQHLRLNELRDSINEVLFPYITLITPYLRVTSWLVWAFTQVDEERKASKNLFTPRQYEEKTELYYQIFATADVLHSRISKLQHHGPVGVERINDALDRLGTGTIHFTSFLSGSRICPIDAYSRALENMKLLQSMKDISHRNEFFLVSTDKGRTLSNVFEKNWQHLLEPREMMNQTTWSQEELCSLGEAICLHGLTNENEESTLLREAAKSSLKQPPIFDGLVEITMRTAKVSELYNLSFKAEDIGRAALYHGFKADKTFLKNSVPRNPATAMIAFHELHTHVSFAADAILAGVSLAAKHRQGGIMLNQILEEATKILSGDQTWNPKRNVEEVECEFHQQLVSIHDNLQLKIPPLDGPFGLETLQNKIGQTSNNAFGLVGWGAIALLQSAFSEECFNTKWLSDTLTGYGTTFSSYIFLQELQAMTCSSTIKDWLEIATKRIIEQHEKVANDKGPYARKIEQNNGYIICTDEPTDYYKNRGRLEVAIAWICDAGLLTRHDNEYRIRSVK